MYNQQTLRTSTHKSIHPNLKAQYRGKYLLPPRQHQLKSNIKLAPMLPLQPLLHYPSTLQFPLIQDMLKATRAPHLQIRRRGMFQMTTLKRHKSSPHIEDCQDLRSHRNQSQTPPKNKQTAQIGSRVQPWLLQSPTILRLFVSTPTLPHLSG